MRVQFITRLSVWLRLIKFKLYNYQTEIHQMHPDGPSLKASKIYDEISNIQIRGDFRFDVKWVIYILQWFKKVELQRRFLKISINLRNYNISRDTTTVFYIILYEMIYTYIQFNRFLKKNTHLKPARFHFFLIPFVYPFF